MGAARAQAEESATDRMTKGFLDSSGVGARDHPSRTRAAIDPKEVPA